MKRNWFFILLMVIAVLPLTSCDKDEEVVQGRNSPLPEYTEKEEIDW